MQAQRKTNFCPTFANSWTSAADAMLGAMRYVQDELTLVEVMAYTGHAFRININAENVDVAGPTAYDWCDILPRGLKNLGFRSRTLRTPDYTPPTPEQLSQAIAMIQESIDNGIPAIAWDLFIPEFGNIYGYDDDKKEFTAKDPRGNGPLPYSQLGRGQTNELFVMTLGKKVEVTKASMLCGALDMAIDHAYHREHKQEQPPYENGLKGYDAWIEAFTKREVSEFGNAYNASVVCDAREFAAQFFATLPEKWNGDNALEQEVRRLSLPAAEHYDAAAEALSHLVRLFPFPQGGTPNDPQHAEAAIQRLRQAKEAEQRAVAILEKMRALFA
jgi:hypothetical protein